MDWHRLSGLEQLEAINSSSFNPDFLGVLIFKHSTRCATSAMAVERIERSWSYSSQDIPTYFLDLLAYREVSNEIASIYLVQHESPQVLFIKNGECIYDASHNMISTKAISKFIETHNKQGLFAL